MIFEDIFIHDEAGKPVSRICFGSELSCVGAIVAQMAPGPVFVITDNNVRKYAEEVAASIDDSGHRVKSVIGINVSEKDKSMETVMSIARRLLEEGADRDAVLLAVGGGITTDIVGFVASVYKRGVRFAYIPTTLLAQTDAAIGGKTGVNFLTYKNILGVINQPVFTFVSDKPLISLPNRDFYSGVAELVKTFIIADADNYEKAIAELSEIKGDISSLIAAAVRIKAQVVSRDQFECGERRKLNLGHTFAHAIESCAANAGYDVTHGEAVAAGIIMAARLSEAQGYAAQGLALRLERDFLKAGLNVSVPFSLRELAEAMTKDKKAEGGIVHFVLIEKIGKVIIVDLSVDDAVKAIENRYIK